MKHTIQQRLILWISQGFGSGRIPVGPGSWGSLVGLLWFVLLLAAGHPALFILGLLSACGLSVWLCGRAEKILGEQDPSSVVLDEIVAVPACYLAWLLSLWMPAGEWPTLESFFSEKSRWLTLGILLLFRLFDILKPWPVRQSQALPGGWGVTVDDLLAAGYVNLVCLAAGLLHMWVQ